MNRFLSKTGALRGWLGGLLAICLLSACPAQEPGSCAADSDCADGELCLNGSCSEAAALCSSDEDCDATANETCVGGICQEAAPALPCMSTGDCPLDQMCDLDVGECDALPTGWCRQPEQCGESKPICSAQTQAVAGRCLECLTDDHCGDGRCISPGVCEGGTPDVEDPATQCPENAYESVPGVCICEDGFVSGGNGTCVPSSSVGELPGTDNGGVISCPPNASPAAPGSDLCSCNNGFELSSSGTSCVPASSVTDPDPPTPPPPGGVPAGWTCLEDFALDQMCDCGCGAFDPACENSSRAVCDYDACYTDNGSIAQDGANHLCEGGGSGGVPQGWTCSVAYYSDPACDCGCGVLDPACPSLSADVCDYADCEYGDPVVENDNTQCTSGSGMGGGDGGLGSWTCSPSWYGDGACDCGCGMLDADCGSLTSSCDYDNCNGSTAPAPNNNAVCEPI